MRLQLILFVFFTSCAAITSASLPHATVFDASQYRGDRLSGIDLDKAYVAITELRKTNCVGDGALTELMMYMATKEKLVDAVNRFAANCESELTYDDGKKKCPPTLSDQFNDFDRANLIPLREQIKESGDRVMHYFGITPFQLANIPTFRQFLMNHKMQMPTATDDTTSR